MAVEAWAASPLSRSDSHGVTVSRSGRLVTPATMAPMVSPATTIGADTEATVPNSDTGTWVSPPATTESGGAWRNDRELSRATSSSQYPIDPASR